MLTWLAYNALLALPLALAAWIAERIWSRRPGIVHLFWLLVLVRLVAPPLPTSGAAPSNVPGPAAGLVTSGADSPLLSAMGWMTRSFGNNWSAGLVRVALGILAAGALCVLLRELTHIGRIQKLLRSATSPSAGSVRSTRAVAARMGTRVPALRVLSGVDAPFLWSLRGGVLVLPEDDPAPTLLAHELAHLARRDHWIAWLELGLMMLLWWNPLFWIARRRMLLASELACDARVVEEFPRQRHDYATALVDAVDVGREGRTVPRARHAIGLGACELEARLRRVLGGLDSAGVPMAWGIALVLAVLCTLPGAAAPSLESFRNRLPDWPVGTDAHGWRTLLERTDSELELHPRDGAALHRRAVALMGLGRFEEALEVLGTQLDAGHEVARTHYNLACAHALSGHPERAVDHLELAFLEGFGHPEYLSLDQDLTSLHGHTRFEALRSSTR